MSESHYPKSSSTKSRRASAAERWRFAVIGACLGAVVTLFASAVHLSRSSAAIPPDLARDLAEASAAAGSAPAPTTVSATTAEASPCGTSAPCPRGTATGPSDAGHSALDVSIRR